MHSLSRSPSASPSLRMPLPSRAQRRLALAKFIESAESVRYGRVSPKRTAHLSTSILRSPILWFTDSPISDSPRSRSLSDLSAPAPCQWSWYRAASFSFRLRKKARKKGGENITHYLGFWILDLASEAASIALPVRFCHHRRRSRDSRSRSRSLLFCAYAVIISIPQPVVGNAQF